MPTHRRPPLPPLALASKPVSFNVRLLTNIFITLGRLYRGRRAVQEAVHINNRGRARPNATYLRLRARRDLTHNTQLSPYPRPTLHTRPWLTPRRIPTTTTASDVYSHQCSFLVQPTLFSPPCLNHTTPTPIPCTHIIFESYPNTPPTPLNQRQRNPQYNT